MSTALVVGVAGAGAAGAAGRWLIDGAVTARLRTAVPLAIPLINILGSLLLGLLTGLTLRHAGADSTVRTVVGTGFCGGFTTFSTASVETVRLLQSRGATPPMVYAGTTLLLSLLAAGAGLALTA